MRTRTLPSPRHRVLRTVSLTLLLLAPLVPAYTRHSWQLPHATVLPQGDLEWAPQPFVFSPGSSVRYIDFENGNDSNNGLTTTSAWKRHPWDPLATANAAAGTGAHTFVFKRGVIYRGQLLPRNSGTPSSPVRLTSDPSWGSGDAWLYGSELVTNWSQGPSGVNPNIPSPATVWYADLNFLPRAVFIVDPTGAVTRLALAREPDWSITDPLDPLRNCWPWRGHTITNLGAGDRHLRWGYPNQLTSLDPNFYTGGLVWTEWGNLMSAPYAAEIEAFIPAVTGIVFQGPWGAASGTPMIINQRYWIEDKPHYLDSPGEFWFERTGTSTGRLYLRLPNDIPPTNVSVEAARHISIIYKFLGTLNYVDISGLNFRFVNVYWPLHYRDFQDYPAVQSAAIHFEGSGTGLSVRNCRFEHVPAAVRFRAYQTNDVLDSITIADNDISHCDRGALEVWDGTASNQRVKPGSLGSVRILRNRIRFTGLRPYRVNGHHTVHLRFPVLAEVAGNILESVGGAGLFVFGGKASVSSLDQPYDAPFTRILLYHNKVKHALLCANDWGAIETWQGGPAYVFNNIAWNPIGPMIYRPERFGAAYYLDGAFKQYYFNNIAWGTPQFLLNKFVDARPAFQEVIGFHNTIANNSAIGFSVLSRRQEGDHGRVRYLGNILDSNTTFVFEHFVNTPTASYDSLAFADNVIVRQTAAFGKFEFGATEYSNLPSFAAALLARHALASSVGIATNGLIFENSDLGDFRPRPASPALGSGVRHFIPWALFTTVGEWHFLYHTNNPTIVPDESWYMAHHWTNRSSYQLEITFPLVGSNISAASYLPGLLEDWARGAVRLNGSNQFFATPASAPGNKSLDIGTNGFVLEVLMRTEPGHVGGTLVAKAGSAGWGYRLSIDDHGCPRFILSHNATTTYALSSGVRVNDGNWHHLLVEFHRPTPSKLNLYINGALANGAEVGTLPPASAWLTNTAPFLVGRDTTGNFFAGTLDFLRVARGTLRAAATTIDELFDWQFAGPMLADFASVPPHGRRDAGALELFYPDARLPRITHQLTNLSVFLGAAGGIRLGVLNAELVQWFKNGQPIPAATNPTLAFAIASQADQGSYLLVASNQWGAVTSAPITVTVIPEPLTFPLFSLALLCHLLRQRLPASAATPI